MNSKREQHINSIKATIDQALEKKQNKKPSIVLVHQRLTVLQSKHNPENLNQEKVLKMVKNLFNYSGEVKGQIQLKTKLFNLLDDYYPKKEPLYEEFEDIDEFFTKNNKPFCGFPGGIFTAPKRSK